jgi:hypothetical protein
VRFRLKTPTGTPGRLEIIDPPSVYQGPPYTTPEGFFPFVNIACLRRGTIVRINVNATNAATAIVGQYYSGPGGIKGDILLC